MSTSAYRIRITPDSIYGCAKKFLNGADDIARARQTLASELGGVGGMAGNDESGKKWSASFDKATAALFQTLTAAVTSVNGMGEGLTRAANNVLAADHKSSVGQSDGTPFSYPMPEGPYTWGTVPSIPSAAGAGSPAWPSPLNKIPNGHQDRLRAAAGDLHRAASSLQTVGLDLEQAMYQVSSLNSAASVDAMNGYFQLIWSPSSGHKPGPLYAAYEGCLKLAQFCETYASQIDTAHHNVEMALPHALEGWRGILAGVLTVAGIAGSLFTASGSDDVAALADASLLAPDLLPAITALTDALDGVIGALDDIIATLQTAADAAPTMEAVEADAAEDASLMSEAGDEATGAADPDPPGGSTDSGPPKAGDLAAARSELADSIGDGARALGRGNGQLNYVASNINKLGLGQKEAAELVDETSAKAFNESGGVWRSTTNDNLVIPPTQLQVRAWFEITPDGEVIPFKGSIGPGDAYDLNTRNIVPEGLYGQQYRS